LSAPRPNLSPAMSHHDTAPRRTLLDERCARHQFEAAVDRCRQCGNTFCGQCLVYSFGEKQPPFCIPCALSASGIRSNAANRPAMPKKELRRRQRAEARVAEEVEARAATTTAQIDWSLPIDGTDPDADPDFPSFEDDEPTVVRPTAPAPPPATPKPKGGLFGRKKNKVVPF
jgi:hypothetical protein